MPAKVGTGGGSVGRGATSNSRGLRFESSHRENDTEYFLLFTVEKTNIKKKEAGNGSFKKLCKKKGK